MSCPPAAACVPHAAPFHDVRLSAADVNPRLQANPHKRLRHLYGARMMTQYRGVPLGELSPHAYAIAEQVSLAWQAELRKLFLVQFMVRLNYMPRH